MNYTSISPLSTFAFTTFHSKHLSSTGMPRFRDLSVHITDSKGNDLKEWGVQNLRNQNKASTYIQATTNMAFKITMQPRFPFRNPDFSSASHNDLTMDDRLGPQEPEELNDEFENPDLRGKVLFARTSIGAATFSSNLKGKRMQYG